MGRGEWGYGGGGGGRAIIGGCGGCSYKRVTLFVCFLNILVALYVLRSLYASLYVHSSNDNVIMYNPDQIRKMEESIRIRRSKEPIELVRLVKKLKQELSMEELRIELSRTLKKRITDEILQRFEGLDQNANTTQQRDMVESWRKEKLKEAKELFLGRKGINSTILQEEAEMIVKALESQWAQLSEEIGLWLPCEIGNQEHDDKPEGEEEPEEIIPGRAVPAECSVELRTDYDGAAVRWGLTHHKESAADCCQACLDHAKHAKPGEMKCNLWVYCPSEFGCYSPDIYEHKHQECWLKYAEKPKLNFKDRYSESYRSTHPKAPVIVPWISGVITV